MNAQKHYLLNPQPITVIYAWGLNFSRGNIVKYTARAGKKGGVLDEIEDMRKVIDYAWYEVQRLEKAAGICSDWNAEGNPGARGIPKDVAREISEDNVKKDGCPNGHHHGHHPAPKAAIYKTDRSHEIFMRDDENSATRHIIIGKGK